MIIRKATKEDISAVSALYAEIHTAEEQGAVTIGWNRKVYPTYATARAAFKRGDLFVEENAGKVVGAAIINQRQGDAYRGIKWKFDAPDNEVMVLHTLVISPKEARKGYGKSFVAYYEEYARLHNCHYLRIDTNERNGNARALYQKLKYDEVDIVPCTFNGIGNVHMVLLEKHLE